MKYVLGTLFILAGIALGLYVGVWVLFVGGIINMIDGAKADPTNSGLIAWGAVKTFILPELVGGLVAWSCWIVAGVCFAYERRPRPRLSNRQVELDWQRRMNNR